MTVSFALLFLVPLSLPASEDTTSSCTHLSTLTSDGWRISSAEVRPARGRLPAHCKVAGVIETEIHFELLLPDDWNGRFVMGGGGGFVGSVQNAAQSPMISPKGTALEQGYATVGTDTGHRGTGIDASWALNHEERQVNFGYRAVHLTARTAKEIVQRYYGKPPVYSYFFGCSRGGGQGMMESQRYPQDFDGIVAGAPAYHWPGIGAGFVVTQQAIFPDAQDLSNPAITPQNRALLAKAIVETCDHLDGVEDGILTDPRRCSFDPAELPRCGDGGPGPDCLTAAQLRAIRSVYDGPRIGGRQLFPGFPFGGENDSGGWDRWITGSENALGPGVPNLHFAFGTQMYKYLVHDDASWNYAAYDFEDWDRDTSRAAKILNATSTDLGEFKKSGGKLILWQGWSDPAITALGTIEYYQALAKSDPGAGDYARLFLMPGVLHCAGGPGPDRVDWLGTIASWVEEGKAPDSIVASRMNAKGESELTRPLCPHPQRAVYKGNGDPQRASSFECRSP